MDSENRTDQTEDIDQIRLFEYPLRQRLPMLILSLFGLLGIFVIEAAVLVSLIRVVTGWEFLSGTGPTDASTLVAAIVIPMLMIFGIIMVHLMLPAIHLRSDSFRISRLFYTSPWLSWSNIRAVRTHWLSSKRRRMVGVSVDGVSQIYDIIGAFQQFDTKTFIVYDGLLGYDELLATLQRHRPELFESER